ncbi:hypothetical protein T439DRAFT_382998 [Meredithblackwellia eburnea MCA 4105]
MSEEAQKHPERFPLRLVDCRATLDAEQVVLRRTYNLEELEADPSKRNIMWTRFAMISHTWQQRVFPKWTLVVDPGPNEQHVDVASVPLVAVLRLANLCLSLKLSRESHVRKTIDFFWMDILCINQTSTEEKGREIERMGSYYEQAVCTLCFPEGIPTIGPPLRMVDGRAPRWHRRAWCLQEEYLPDRAVRDREEFFRKKDARDQAFGEGEVGEDRLRKAFKAGPSPKAHARSPEQSAAQKVDNSHNGKTLFVLIDCNNPLTNQKYRLPAVPLFPPLVSRGSKGQTNVAFGSFNWLSPGESMSAGDKSIFVLKVQWNLWSFLHLMYARESFAAGDKIYGTMGLLRLNIDRDIFKGQPVRLVWTDKKKFGDAMEVLASFVRKNKLLFLTTIESYHSDDDKMSTSPRLDRPVPHAVPGPTLDHYKLLGHATFNPDGEKRLHIFAKAASLVLASTGGLFKHCPVEVLPHVRQSDLWPAEPAMYLLGAKCDNHCKSLKYPPRAAETRNITIYTALGQAACSTVFLLAVSNCRVPKNLQDQFSKKRRRDLLELLRRSGNPNEELVFCLVCRRANSGQQSRWRKVGIAIVAGSAPLWSENMEHVMV